MAARQGHIDCSTDTFIAVCEACPTFRGAPHTMKASALADLEVHRRHAHPVQARDAAKKARRRRHLIDA